MDKVRFLFLLCRCPVGSTSRKGRAHELTFLHIFPTPLLSQIFRMMDKDKDSRLSYEEFAEGSKKDPTIVQVRPILLLHPSFSLDNPRS